MLHECSYVDYATQKRYPKASANWYTKVVKAHKDGSSNGKKSNGNNKHDSNVAGNGGTSSDSTEKSGIHKRTQLYMHVSCFMRTYCYIS
jgi:hypothetical protein